MIFFFNDTATTEIYTLSLHDALPISVATMIRQRFAAHIAHFPPASGSAARAQLIIKEPNGSQGARSESTRLNSSHANISYAVFCLKKKLIYSHFFSNSSNFICHRFTN